MIWFAKLIAGERAVTMPHDGLAARVRTLTSSTAAFSNTMVPAASQLWVMRVATQITHQSGTASGNTNTTSYGRTIFDGTTGVTFIG